MKKRIVFLIAATTLSVSAFAQTASEVVDKHIAAVGGADKVNAIKSAEYEQSMNIMGMDMTGKTTLVVGQSSRTDVSVMGSQITTVIDGDKGWTINPMAGGTTPQALPTEQVKLQKGNTEITGLQVAYAKMRNYPTELVGKEQLNGKDVYNLKVTRPEAAVNYYVDATTYQLVGSKAVVSAQGQTAEVKASFSDHKAVEGVTVPHTVELTSPAMPSTLTTKVTKLTVNPKVDAGIFAMPK